MAGTNKNNRVKKTNKDKVTVGKRDYISRKYFIQRKGEYLYLYSSRGNPSSFFPFVLLDVNILLNNPLLGFSFGTLSKFILLGSIVSENISAVGCCVPNAS
jgi:hypothetical protein